MADSIKKQIVARWIELLQPLITANRVRHIERKTSLYLLEPEVPAIHVVVGDEAMLNQEEDYKGVTMDFPILTKVMLKDYIGALDDCDDLVSWIQAAVETDLQLNNLANRVSYNGELPFTVEIDKPDGGVVLMYLIEYRRLRGDPATKY